MAAQISEKAAHHPLYSIHIAIICLGYLSDVVQCTVSSYIHGFKEVDVFVIYALHQ